MAARIEENLKDEGPGYRYSLGMWVGLASIAMLFTSLSSAYIVRAGSATDWFPLVMPRVLLLSTGLIIVSSATIEMARRKLKAALGSVSAQWLLVTVVLGIGFLVSQLVAWKQLTSQGVYLASNPHSSFFYLLTAAHAVHLIGGLLALIFLWLRSQLKKEAKVTATGKAVADAVSIYWHFMDALW